LGYSTDFTAIFDALISTVQSCSSFTTSNTTGAYIKDWSGVSYPVCTIRPRSDERIAWEIGNRIEERRAVFRVEIRNLGTGTQNNQDTMISLVGEIKDAIDGSNDLGGVSGIALIAYDQDIEYSQRRGVDRNAVIYYSIMLIRVEYTRTVS
jgi:hypothetical protein